MKKLSSRLLYALTLALLAAVPAAAGNLFSPLSEELQARALVADTAYSALVHDPATSTLQLVKAHAEEVNARAERLTLNLGPGLDLQAVRVNSYRTGSGTLFWYGVIAAPGTKELDFDPANSVFLLRNGKKLTGNVRYDGQWYQIRPLKGRGHAIVTVDPSQLAADHPPEFAQLPTIPMQPGQPQLQPRVNTVITVLVNYTQAAASESGDINGIVDLAVAESNQGYANSGVQITLQLVKKAQTTYTESNNFSTDLTRYRSTSDGYMDYIHTQRTQYGADVAVLLTTKPTSGCGLASGIGSSASTAFAVSRWGCATGNYTFAHEIGHLQSARHDPFVDSSNSPYAYGHGYVYTGSPSWRTIMAYPNACGSCQRLNYWSNPNNTYNGVPMGTASTHDNTRVLNNTRGTVAGFKSVPSCVPDGGSDDTLGQTSCCSGVAVSGSTYCTNPADWGTTWASCNHICGTQLVGGCVPSGGVDDTLYSTSCCSGQAVSGSTWCLNPADYGTTWKTCAHICM